MTGICKLPVQGVKIWELYVKNTQNYMHSWHISVKGQEFLPKKYINAIKEMINYVHSYDKHREWRNYIYTINSLV